MDKQNSLDTFFLKQAVVILSFEINIMGQRNLFKHGQAIPIFDLDNYGKYYLHRKGVLVRVPSIYLSGKVK